MAVEETVTWSRTRTEAGCVSGAVLGVVGGMLASLPLSIVLPERWAWVGFVPVVVLPAYGAVRGWARRRAEVVTAEFGSRHVVLANASGTRTVDVAELAGVEVIHRGLAGGGYHETVLSLAFEARPAELIPGRYDPELVTNLRRLFGPAVEVGERHEELVPPSTG